MHSSFYILFFFTSLPFLGIAAQRSVSGEQGAVSHVAVENAYLETAYDPTNSPVWSHESPFDLSVAVALNSPKNITGQETAESRIISAFKLALEMNQLDALEKLLQVYEGQDWPDDIIMKVLLRPSHKPEQWKLFKALAQRGLFSKKEAELERLLLLAVKDIDDTRYFREWAENVILNLTVTVESVPVLRQALFTAAKLGHDWVGMRIFSKAQERLEQNDIDIAYQLASNRDKKGRLAKELRPFGKEYIDAFPVIEVINGHFPGDIPDASEESQFIASLYHTGFGRLVVKLTEKTPTLLRDILIKSAADPHATLHTALQQTKLDDLAGFMVACVEGFDDVVDAFIKDGKIKEYAHLPFFKDVCLSNAVTNKQANLVTKLVDAFSFDQTAFASALKLAVSDGNLEIVQKLIEAGADPVDTENAPFLEACAKGLATCNKGPDALFPGDLVYDRIIWYLFAFPKVKEHKSTPRHLALYLFSVNDIDGMRKVFLGEPPVLSFDPISVNDAIMKRYERSLADFLNDHELACLLAHHHDKTLLVTLFKNAVALLQNSVVKAFLDNLDLFDESLAIESLKTNLVVALAANRYSHTAMILVNNPRRSRRDRYRLQFRLLQRYAEDEYATDDFISALQSSSQLHLHLKYYLPSKTLNRIFPDSADWESDHFLREVKWSDNNWSDFNRRLNDRQEKTFMLMFFDKSAGLFGNLSLDGGTMFNDVVFIHFLQNVESARPLPEGDQLDTLKKHLWQVAEAAKTYLTARSTFDGYMKEKLKSLPVNDTYLFSVRGGGHTGYALATKKDDSLLNVKVFNSYHDMVTKDESTSKIVPYIEWDGLPLEEVLSKDFDAFENDKFIFSDTHPVRPPQNLPAHMWVKGQKIGSCSAFKFWLIARYDLESLPRFLEFSVALHLFLVEDLLANFAMRMREWNVLISRGWQAITWTPHFEGQLLKDIEDIKKDHPAIYKKLHDQIIQSVQRRYRTIYPDLCNWNNEQAVLDFIQWRRKFLEEIKEDGDKPMSGVHSI